MNDSIDMEKLIEKRLLEINNYEDRKETREILGQIFKEIHKYADSQWVSLKQDIAEEMRQQKDLTIYTGIATSKTYDITAGNMFPMRAEDLEKQYISTKDLMQELSQGNAMCVFSVFIESDYESIRKLINQKRFFNGYILTMNGEYPITAELRPATRYHEMIRKLFQVFINNGMSWNTVCTAYLSKFFDVYLYDAQIPFDEEIESIKIDFNEYEQKVKYDYFPIWNIKEDIGVSEVKRIPCLGQVMYQHTISKKCDKEDAFLVVDTEDTLTIKKNTNEIVFNSSYPETRKWMLYHVIGNVAGYWEYPILSNELKDGNTMPARTKGDIFRVVNSLSNNTQIRLHNVLFPDVYKSDIATYSMEKNITEEYESLIKRAPMVLQFTCLREDYLTLDIISYIVTVVQRKYPEFSCYGEIVKE